MQNNNTSSFFTGLLIGAVTGAVAGILLAPKSGEETREDIKKFAVDVKDKATDLYDNAKKEVEKKIAQLKKAGENIDETKYKSLVNEVVEEFRKDSEVTSSVAKKLGEQLSKDWGMFKKELSS